jgi:1,2-phenylacetyl-CoA epoxidase PaaB subunit
MKDFIAQFENESPKPWPAARVYRESTFNFRYLSQENREAAFLDLYTLLNLNPEMSIKKASMDIWRQYFKRKEVFAMWQVREDKDAALEGEEPIESPSSFEKAIYGELVKRGLLEKVCTLCKINLQDILDTFKP